MLSNLINTVLGASLEARLAARPKATIFGWRALFAMTELPSLSDDLTRLYRSYGKGMTPERVREFAKDIPAFRAVVDISYTECSALCGVVFELGAGSFLVVFPHHDDSATKVLGYVMGEATLAECSRVAGQLIDAFEDHVMPSEPHAGEPLFLT